MGLCCEYLDYVVSDDRVTDELGRIWKEAAVA
jgi:hypothetical protein